MHIVQTQQKIAGAQVGETIWVHLISGKTEKVVLIDILTVGIEGLEFDLKSQPLTFYPFSSILKITKFTEVS